MLRLFLIPIQVRCARRRVMLGLCAAHVIWLQLTYGQRLYTSFGQVAERALGFTPTGLAVHMHPGGNRSEVAVLAKSPPELYTFALSDSGTILQLGASPLGGARQGLIAADPGVNGEPQFLCLSADGADLCILTREGGVYREKTLPLSQKSDRLLLADIDNDGRKDVLLFGKNRTGVSTLLGRPGGRYVPGPELFVDISISDLTTVDLNGDGITDVLACNWLSNQLSLYYGISRMVFSEQGTFELPGEPDRIATTWLDRHRFLGVAISIPGERKIALLRAAPSGDLQLEGTMSLPGRPVALGFAPIHDEAIPDLVIPADDGIIVSRGAGLFEFSPPTLLGPGEDPAGWALADVDGDRKTDLAVAERGAQRLVFLANAEHGSSATWPSCYAVGSKPLGVVTADFDGDGRQDIAVANSSSATVSLLFNRGRHRFTGQQTVFVPEGPAHLTIPYSAPHAVIRTLVSAHPSVDQVGVLTLQEDPLRATSFSIPTGPEPRVIHAWEDTSALRILLRYGARNAGARSLSLFEQIGGRQFLERALRASLPERLAVVSMEQEAGREAYTIAYVSSEGQNGKCSLSLADVSKQFSAGPVKQSLTFFDSTSSTTAVIPATLTAGGLRDMIIVLGRPDDALLIALRNPDGSFRPEIERIPDVALATEEDLVVRDVDGDGHPDITVRNTLTDEIQTFFGSSRGFGRGVRICSARGVRGFAIAPLVVADIQDLVLTRYNEGTVVILYAPFRHQQ